MRFQNCRLNVLRVCLLATTAISPIAGFAEDLPVGGSVAAGIASITTPSASQMNIDQGSQNAIINWQGFSVGQGAQVNIAQPNANSALLNRVTGSATSSIHGQINANGQVLIVNPNGIQIGPNGVINTQSFGASTLGISDENFLSGNLEFEGSGASALVSNEGQIAVQQGGYAALLGGRVNNAGTITAPLGSIGLGAGERVTLDFSGDGFLQVTLPSDVDGDEALIENSGVLSANGGRIEISAATARNLARHAINLTGVAEARSVSGRSGAIVLGGGNGGIVTIDGGTLDVSAEWDTGGDITVLGQHAELTFATLDASGALGGGSIRLGGDMAGGGDLQTASELWIDGGTRVLADAITSGNGGDVVLWADDLTVFDGYISATGGSDFGDGGFAEVSGKAQLSFSGMIDMSAENGDDGNVLLDPYDWDVIAFFEGYDPVDNPNTILNTTLNALLEAGNYELTTVLDGADDGNITVSAPVTWSSDNILTLRADQLLNINAAISAPSGGLEISVDNAFTNDAGTINVNRFELLDGNWLQMTGSLPDFNADDFSINSQTSEFLRATGGLGTLANPYTIEDVFALQGMASASLLDNHFALADNIDASGTEFWNFYSDEGGSGFDQFTPIGDSDLAFTGSLDGRDFTITGLELDTFFAGLFGETQGATIRNLNMADVNVFGAGQAAGLVATARNTQIEDVSVTGVVNGSNDVYLGGIAAALFGSTISDSSVDVDISVDGFSTGFRLVGAMAGSLFDGSTIERSGSAGTIDATGGILFDEGSGSDGEELDHQDFGGLVANIDNTSGVIHSFSSVDISVSNNGDMASNIGGLVGHNFGSIEESYATGDVEETSGYYGERIDGGDRLGGLAGFNEGTITETYATGGVTIGPDTQSALGGLVGQNWGQITNSYATGPVSDQNGFGAASLGGLVGLDTEGSFLSGGFWDTTTTGQSSSAGGTGLTTEEFQDPDIFLPLAIEAGWSGADEPFRLSWSAPASGTYPQLYSVTPVFYASNLDYTAVYGLGDGYEYGWGINGGPSVYVFGPADDVLDPSSVFENAFVNFNAERKLDVGTYTIPGSADTVTSEGGVEYLVIYPDGPYEVTPKEATLTSLDQTKVYGDASFTLDLDAYTIDGLVSGDDPFVDMISAGESVAATVGDGPYTIGFTEGIGLEFSNYDLTLVTGNLTVTPADLTVTALDQNKIYKQAEFFLDSEAFSVVGLLNNDFVSDVSLVSSGEAFEAAAGTYDIVPTISDGSGLENYAVNYVDGTLTVDARLLTIGVQDQTKVYGDESFTLDPDALGFEGLHPTDSIASITLSSDGEPVTANVGNYDINASDPIGSGLENYDISYQSGTLAVTPADLTLTVFDGSKTYGETYDFNSGAYEVSGLLNSDDVTDVPLDSLGAPATADVGTYDINLGDIDGTGLGNYNIEYSVGSLTVEAADLTITASNQGKTYGDEEFTLGTTGFTAVGLVNADTVTSVALSSDGESVEADIGTYDILASQAAGTGLGNYTIVYQPGTLTVGTALLTITANAQTKVYGDGDFSLDLSAFSFEGLNEGDTISSVSLTSLGAVVTADVGDYVITPSDALGNGLDSYDISYQIGTLSVTPADLTVSASNASKVYGATHSFDGSSFEVAGLLNNDTVTDVALASDGAPGTAVVGAYDITAGDASGSGLGNYLISYVPGTLDVAPADLTVTATDQGKTYGDAEFSLGNSAFTVVGLLNADNVATVALSSEGEPVEAESGIYDIFANDAAGTGLDNYNITYETGTLSVGDSILTISALTQSKTYADEDFSLDLSAFDVTGLVGEDQVTSVSLSSAGTEIGATVGSYLLDISDAIGSGLDSYTIVYVDSLLEVIAAPLTISIANQAKTYGDLLELASTAFTTTGLAAFDNVVSVNVASEGTGVDATVGDYAITGSAPIGTNLENYNVTIEDGTLNVAQRGLTISAVDRFKILGTTTTFNGDEFNVAGLVNDDTVVSANIASEGAPAEATIDGSPYEITVSDAQGTGLANYDIDYQSATLTINAPQTNLPPGGETGGGGGNGIDPDDTKKTDPSGLPNPTDEITNLIGPEVKGESNSSGSQSRGDTGELEIILALSNDFEVAASACRQSNAGADDYLGCIADALEKYSDALEEATVDLPPELQEISAIIQEARQGVLDARNQARVRMAGATTSAERLAIETQAIAQARNSIQNAQGEIRKTIALLRAGEPEIFEVREEQINVVISALQTADTELARAVGL